MHFRLSGVGLCRLALTEYHRADAHDCAALGNGDRVVVGHTFRDLAERWSVWKVALFQFVKQLLCLMKLTTYLRSVIRIASHSHQSYDTHMLQFAPRLIGEQLSAFVLGESIFGLFLGYMYL